jgi:HB1, ASXL, restriction endonuclease HTH domain
MYVDVLRDKRAEVLAEIERLRAQASELAGRLAAKEGQLRNLDDLLALETGDQEARQDTDAPAQRAQSAKTQRFTDAAVEILTERGKPVHYLELTKLIGERGVYVPGKEPGANLIAHMLRDERFTRAPARGTYGLAAWPGMRDGAARPRRTGGTVRRTRTRTPRQESNNG